MTFDEWWEDFIAEHDEWKYADSAALRRAAFEAGAASRDAEVAQWQNIIDEEAKDSALVIIERDQLSAQINRLLDAVKVVEADSEEVLDFDECTAMCIPMDTYHGLIEAAEATCEQSIAAYRNKVIEECAAVLNVAITRLSSCGASIKNDVAISTLKEQSCRLRAMKEQP